LTRFRYGLTLAIAASLVAACGGTDEPQAPSAPEDGVDVAAAKSEGSLVIYTVAAEETIAPWVAPFEEEYGIDVELYRAPQEVLWERFSQETQVEQHAADILINNDNSLLAEADEKGWLAEFTPETDGDFSGDAVRSGKWYPLYQTAEPVAWNTNNVTEDEAEGLEEDPLNELRDERWAGRVAVVAPQATQRVLASYYRWADEQEDDLGWEFVEDIAAHKPVIFESAQPLVQRLEAGEFDVVLGSASSIVGRSVNNGAPIQFSFPEVSTAATFAQAVSANAPNPNAARLFQEWATTPEALSALSEAAEGIPPHDGVQDNRAVVKLPWYEAPAELDADWESDEDLQKAAPDLLAKWADLFGYL
jgi:ABC-type Fe3+ transport system substrate-binding protein